MLSVLPRLVRRPLLHHLPLATYSTIPQTSRLQQILNEEADKQEMTSSTGTMRQTRPSSRQWKSLEAGRFVRPHHLTYKSRLDGPRPPGKPPSVGPGRAESRYGDIFYQLGIDPLDQCFNPVLLSSFVTEMGKIRGRNVTKLTVRSQRRLGRAIRRAKMMGIMPILSKPKMASWMNCR